jgi:glycerophosphoryl diester phosphodiesterase
MLILSKKGIKIFIVFCIVTACNEGEKKRIHQDDNSNVINIGHAGSGFNYLFMPFNPYPSNSFSSLKKALKNGAAGVEVDLQITSDNELVLFHDLQLDNLTNLTGSVFTKPIKEITGASYQCGFPYDFFHRDSVITFMRWITYARSLTSVPYLQIDIKTSNSQSEESILDLLKIMNNQLSETGYPMEKVIAISVDKNILLKLQSVNASIPIAFEPGDFNDGLSWVLSNNCKYLILDHKSLTSEKVQEAHDNGIGVIAFGGRSKTTLKKILSMKPDFIQSNNVKLLFQLIQEN